MNQNSTSARSWGTIVTHSDEMAIIYRGNPPIFRAR